MPGRLRNSDAFAWSMEADPLLRSTVVSVWLLDRAPDWDALVERVRRVAAVDPGFQERVVPARWPWLAPSWRLDPDFELDWHLRRQALPAGGGFDAVLEVAQRAALADFDRARPLWEFTLLEGLADGRAAFVVKLHHSLADGFGGLQLALHLVDDTGWPAPAPHPAPPWRLPRPRLVSPWEVARTAVSIGRVVRPVLHRASPVLVDRRLSRRFGVVDVPLADMKKAAHAAGVTVNDVFLGALTGGLRVYHDKFGASVDELWSTLPINLRQDVDEIGGNRITLARLRLPVGLADPALRLRELDRRVRGWRAEPSLPYTQQIAGALNLLPRGYVAHMFRNVDFLASNVPGFPFPVSVAGARVERQYGFGPTIGAAFNATMLSYNGTCHLAVNADAGAVADLPLLLECIDSGVQEVLAVAD